MDKQLIEKMLAMMESSNDADAVMGLRGMQGLFKSEGVDLSTALIFAAGNMAALRSARPTTIDAEPAQKPAPAAAAPVIASGMPQCLMHSPGHIAIILPGKTAGEPVPLPGAAAAEAADIALHLKDAIVAAVLNKSRFKLKLLDVKNGRGEVAETVLQAEYERPGMTPVRVWSNVKGEVATLAAVLRRAVANTMPELVAA